MSTFVPIHQLPFERSKGLENWIRSLANEEQKGKLKLHYLSQRDGMTPQ